MRVYGPRLLHDLPLYAADLTLRCWTRDDLERLAAWPPYPFPYEALSIQLREPASGRPRQHLCGTRANPARITLTASRDGNCAGYLALLEIDWHAGLVGTLGIRVHPEHCGRGIGTTMLLAVLDMVRTAVST